MKGFGGEHQQHKAKKIINKRKGAIYFSEAIEAHRAGKIQKAKNLYLKAIANSFEEEALYLNLGVIYKNQGELEEASKCHRRVLRMNPYSSDAYTNLSSLKIAKNDFKSALKLANKAISLNPKCAIAKILGEKTRTRQS